MPNTRSKAGNDFMDQIIRQHRASTRSQTPDVRATSAGTDSEVSDSAEQERATEPAKPPNRIGRRGRIASQPATPSPTVVQGDSTGGLQYYDPQAQESGETPRQPKRTLTESARGNTRERTVTASDATPNDRVQASHRPENTSKSSDQAHHEALVTRDSHHGTSHDPDVPKTGPPRQVEAGSPAEKTAATDGVHPASPTTASALARAIPQPPQVEESQGRRITALAESESSTERREPIDVSGTSIWYTTKNILGVVAAFIKPALWRLFRVATWPLRSKIFWGIVLAVVIVLGVLALLVGTTLLSYVVIDDAIERIATYINSLWNHPRDAVCTILGGTPMFSYLCTSSVTTTAESSDFINNPGEIHGATAAYMGSVHGLSLEILPSIVTLVASQIWLRNNALDIKHSQLEGGLKLSGEIRTYSDLTYELGSNLTDLYIDIETLMSTMAAQLELLTITLSKEEAANERLQNSFLWFIVPAPDRHLPNLVTMAAIINHLEYVEAKIVVPIERTEIALQAVKELRDQDDIVVDLIKGHLARLVDEQMAESKWRGWWDPAVQWRREQQIKLLKKHQSEFFGVMVAPLETLATTLRALRRSLMATKDLAHERETVVGSTLTQSGYLQSLQLLVKQLRQGSKQMRVERKKEHLWVMDQVTTPQSGSLPEYPAFEEWSHPKAVAGGSLGVPCKRDRRQISN